MPTATAIHLPDGSMKNVIKTGDINFSSLILKDTLYLPSFKHNLLSVNKLTKTNSVYCLFCPNFYLLQDLRSKKLVAVGKVVGNLYILHQFSFSSSIIEKFDAFSEPPCNRQSDIICTNSRKIKKDSDLSFLWHTRLGHPSDVVLQQLPFILKPDSTVCELHWITYLLDDLHIQVSYPIELSCDNQAAIYISQNPVFHEKTKHLEIDCHIVGDKLKSGFIRPKHEFSRANSRYIHKTCHFIMSATFPFQVGLDSSSSSSNLRGMKKLLPLHFSFY